MAEAFDALYADWDEALSHSGEDAVWGLTQIPSVMINNATRVRFKEICRFDLYVGEREENGAW